MPRVPPASAEVERAPTSRALVTCPHCGKKKSRWTVWRHTKEKNNNAAHNARTALPTFYPRLIKRNLHLPSRSHPLPPNPPRHPSIPPPPVVPSHPPLPLSPSSLAAAPLNDDGAWIDDPSVQLNLDLDRPLEANREPQDAMDVDPTPSTPPPRSPRHPSPLGSPGSLDDNDETRSLGSASTSHSSSPPSPRSPSQSPQPQPHHILGDENDDDEDDDEEEVILQPQGPRSQTYSTRLPPPPRLTNDLQKLRAARLKRKEGIPRTSRQWFFLRLFKHRIKVNQGANAYSKFQFNFPEFNIPTLKELESEIRRLSELEVVTTVCCKNSCISFSGRWEEATHCPFCGASRFRPNSNVPQKVWHFITPTSQLQALFAGVETAKLMRHRHENHDNHKRDPHRRISDVYDSELYRRIRASRIVVNGQITPHHFFDDPHDVFLISMTDGFQVFPKSKESCWPLLFINANLPPAIRYRWRNTILGGLIPGPKKPKDFDSFMFVVMVEMSKLAQGVNSYDALDDKIFPMRVVCPLGVGDMPASTLAYSGTKNHNAINACKIFCGLSGIRSRGSNSPVYYHPIRRPPGFPPLEIGDLHHLPWREHDEFLRQGRLIEMAPTEEESKRLSRLYGIVRIPMMIRFPGVRAPDSFPFEFMHLLENTFKNYINFFSGNFKGLDAGVESYIIPKAKWEAIGAATTLANATVPSTFGRRIPNVSQDRTYMTAEAHVVWCTLYAPILLMNAFDDQRYYDHFLDLVSIVQRLLAFTTTAAERLQLRKDIVKWYEAYEKTFYQYNETRLSTCLMTVHAWLHLVDYIERSGPLWSYWTWVMERYCSVLSRAVKSRKHPYASIDRRIMELAALSSIRNRYDLHDDLPHYSLFHNPRPSARFFLDSYPDHHLVGPRLNINFRTVDASLPRRIAAHLATQIEPPPSDNAVLRLLPPNADQYAKVYLDKGDLVWSMQYRRRSGERDRSYVQYAQLVDKHRNEHHVAPEFEKQVFFARLERAFVINLPASDVLQERTPTQGVVGNQKLDRTSDPGIRTLAGPTHPYT